jgi:hypothetical protein
MQTHELFVQTLLYVVGKKKNPWRGHPVGCEAAALCAQNELSTTSPVSVKTSLRCNWNTYAYFFNPDLVTMQFLLIHGVPCNC